MKTNTINKKEIEKFSKIAEEWWNPDGKFKPLHKFNPLRISYIKKKIISHFDIKSNFLPLKNMGERRSIPNRHYLTVSTYRNLALVLLYTRDR